MSGLTTLAYTSTADRVIAVIERGGVTHPVFLSRTGPGLTLETHSENDDGLDQQE